MNFTTFLLYFLVSAFIFQVLSIILINTIRYIYIKRQNKKQEAQVKQIITALKSVKDSEEEPTWQ